MSKRQRQDNGSKADSLCGTARGSAVKKARRRAVARERKAFNDSVALYLQTVVEALSWSPKSFT